MIETKNLCKTYLPKNGYPVKALDNVSLKLADKGMVFILGKSGSGKSTFLNVLGGLDRYDDGELIVYGKSSKNFSQSDFDSYRNTYIGFVFQEYNIMQEFSVGQNIGLALQLQGKKATKEAVADILAQVDLKGFENRKTNELSGGQKQRVAIARALIKDPKIIMADEPTGALDSKTGEQVFDTLKKLSGDKLVLVVSHDRDFAERYADRIIEFCDGKVVSDTTKTEISPTVESSAVTVIGGKILQIKKGTDLTEKDLDVINNYLKNADGDAFISMDGSLNKELRKTSKISENGGKETFKNTEKEDVAVKTYEKGAFKTIKSRLPIANSLKIAASSLKSKPIRLFFTIVLSSIAFTLFGLMAVFSTYDKKTAYIETFYDLGTETVFVQRTEKYFYGSEEDDYVMIQTNINSADVASLNTDFADKNLPFIGVGGLSGDLSYNASLGSELSKLTDYYHTSFSGVATVSESQLQNSGKTLYGALPTAKDEIAVTDYFFEVYKASFPQNVSATLTDFNSIIGKTINLGSVHTPDNRKITAVIDTDFDADGVFSPLKTADGTNDMPPDEIYTLKERLAVDLNGGLSNLCFVSEAYMRDFELKNTVYDLQFDFGGITLENDDGTNSVYIYDYYLLSSLNDFENRLEYLFYLPNGKNFGDSSVVIDIRDSGVSENEFCAAYEEQINALELPSAFADVDEYCVYLANDGWENNAYASESGKEIMRRSLLQAAEVCWNNLPDKYKTLKLPYALEGQTTAYVPLTVAGVFVGETASKPQSIKSFSYDAGRLDTVFLGDKVAGDYAHGKLSGAYRGAVGTLPDDKSELRSFVNYFGEIEEDKGWELVSFFISDIEMMDFLITMLSKVFLYAGVAIAAFAVVLMMNFIATSIVYKKREIGILRAVGARGLDVFGIFLYEAIIIALINFAVSAGLLSLCVFGLNSTFRTGFTVALTIFAVSPLPLLLMLGLSLLTAFVASFIPSFRISLKRPIDAIQNR